MVGRFGSGIWTPCLSRGPDIDDSSNSLMGRTSQLAPNPSTPNFMDKEIKPVGVWIDRSGGAAAGDVTYPPVVRTWGG